MKRKWILGTLLAAIPIATATMTGTALADHDDPFEVDRRVTPQVVPVPVRPDCAPAPRVRVWTRQGEGSVLFPGESLDIVFRTNRDAFVVVFNIDTRGRVRKLFPTGPYDDGFVRGERKVSLPGRHARYRLKVTGPAGIERIVALASDEPLVHTWRDYIEDDFCYENSGYNRKRKHRSSSWSASATVPLGRGSITVSAGDRRIKQKVVPVPVGYADVSRDETWFRVARRRGWIRY